jgi:hypothetical protein
METPNSFEESDKTLFFQHQFPARGWKPTILISDWHIEHKILSASVPRKGMETL